MHTLGNVQDARNMQTLAEFAASLLTVVNGIPPERLLELRMKMDGGHDMKVDRIMTIDLKVNTDRVWISVEFLYTANVNDAAATYSCYDIWVVGDNELTGSF